MSKIVVPFLCIIWFSANVIIEYMILGQSLYNDNILLDLVAFCWPLFAILPMLFAYEEELTKPVK
jgi:hypothetical protein